MPPVYTGEHDESVLHFVPVLLGQGCGRFDYLRVDLITLALRHLDLVVAPPSAIGIIVEVYRPQHT